MSNKIINTNLFLKHENVYNENIFIYMPILFKIGYGKQNMGLGCFFFRLC